MFPALEAATAEGALATPVGTPEASVRHARAGEASDSPAVAALRCDGADNVCLPARGSAGDDSVQPRADEPKAIELTTLSAHGPERFEGLDREQRAALERLEVALAQQPAIGDGPEGDDAAPADSGISKGAPPSTLSSTATRNAIVSAETRSLPLGWGQRQADAFCLTAETSLANGPTALQGGDRHIVHVRVDLETIVCFTRAATPLRATMHPEFMDQDGRVLLSSTALPKHVVLGEVGYAQQSRKLQRVTAIGRDDGHA